MPTTPAASLFPSQTQHPITELLTSALNEHDDGQEDDSEFERDGDGPRPWRISLFWHTFGLMALLMTAGVLAGYWLQRTMDDEPRLRENARQTVFTITFARAAMLYAEPAQRPALIQALMQQGHLRILSRSGRDQIAPLDDSREDRRLAAALRDQLGAQTVVARSVNGASGLWISFTVGRDEWWLWLNRTHTDEDTTSADIGIWLIWSVALVVLLGAGTALLTRLINRPLTELAAAAVRVREGDYTGKLDETVRQAEVRAVNARFNRMTEQLVRTGQERAQMLAGISHDLRTPLARLRLEIELGVPDEETRERMAADIEQVGSALNKFLDYVRPGRGQLSVVELNKLTQRCARAFAGREDMSVQVDVPQHARVLADETELARVITNLLENAGRYGQTPGTGFTLVRVAATIKEGWVRLRVRDYGAGVPPDQLDQITRPFYRGDTARQNAVGTGLGLAIVARMVEAMGGKFRLVNAKSGGLLALIRLQLADGPGSAWGGRGNKRKRMAVAQQSPRRVTKKS